MIFISLTQLQSWTYGFMIVSAIFLVMHYGRTDKQTDQWIDRQTDGRTDGPSDGQIEMHVRI